MRGSRALSRFRIPRTLLATLVVTPVLLAMSTPILAQSAEMLTPGDVVRIEYDFGGTLMSVDQSTLTIIGEGKPICWPGLRHGEAPRCDPAPSVRRVVDWHGATVERQLVDQSYLKRTAVGFLIGAVAMGPIGYATGPSLGYGKIPACIEVSASRLCTESIRQEEADRIQKGPRPEAGGLLLFDGGRLGRRDRGSKVGKRVARGSAADIDRCGCALVFSAQSPATQTSVRRGASPTDTVGCNGVPLSGL